MRARPALLTAALGLAAAASFPAPALAVAQREAAAKARQAKTQQAPAQPRTPAKTPDGTEAVADPRTLWPAGLERIAGRYRFAQVASPGGLWMETGKEKRQVSLHELSPAMQERLKSAEIVIAELKLPSVVEASQRLSPAKRGMLRYYSESAPGKLTLKGLPGVGGEQDDKGEYEGPVLFTVEHASHSNPSVAGVLNQRRQQETTWGAATLDFADLGATPVPAEGGEPGEEVHAVVGNARILRSGVEIFAFVNWTERTDDGTEKRYTGSVRLERQAPAARP